MNKSMEITYATAKSTEKTSMSKFREHGIAIPGYIEDFEFWCDQKKRPSVEEARQFAKLLRETSKAPVAYAEIPGAQHAFEVFHSQRTTHVTRAVGRFLGHVHSQYLRERGLT